MTKLFDRSTRAGFTLVELIVVIAILGILAGIAIPVYSGYVEKTQLAADYVLLDAAKKALAAAALEHGVDSADLIVTLSVDNNHCIDGFDDVTGDWTGFSLVPLSARRNGGGIVFSSLAAHPRQYAPAMLSESATTNEDALEGSFIKFFAENADTPLQTLYKQELVLAGDDVLNMTYVNEDGNVTLTVTNSNGTATYKLSKTQIDALNNSTFGTNMTKGELMADISKMTNSLAGMLKTGGLLATMVNALVGLDKLGITEPYDPNELSNGVVAAIGSMALRLVSDEDEESGELLINSVKVAGAAAQMTGAMGNAQGVANIKTMMENLNSANLMSALGDNSGQGLLGVLSLYATATGFANSDAANNGADKWTYTDENGKQYSALEYYNYINDNIERIANSGGNPATLGAEIMNEMSKLSNLMGTQTESGFSFNEQYATYATNQLEADSAGFINSMVVIGENTDAFVASGAIKNGFDNTSIEAILNAIYNTDTATGGAGE